MQQATIYVIDELVARPGEGEAVLAAYMERYAAGARQRGMALERVLVSPPMWLVDQSNTLTISWTLNGAAAWWQMSFLGRNDPEVRAFWAEMSERLVSRKRSFASAAEDVKVLSDV